MAEGKIFLKVPAETVYLALIRKAIVELADKVGFPEGEVAKIEMAVDEACTSVIRHSYDGHEEAQSSAGYEWRREDEVGRPIELRVRVDSEKVSIDLADRGKGFDLNRFKPDLDEYLKSMEMGQLGMYVIKTFMDEVHYTYTPGVGNTLKMVKYFKKIASR